MRSLFFYYLLSSRGAAQLTEYALKEGFEGVRRFNRVIETTELKPVHRYL
jgi:hypothetical protein